MLAQLPHIVVEVFDSEQVIAMEPVPARLVAAHHIAHGQGNYLPVIETYDPPQRPDPTCVASPPSHRLGPGELRDHIGEGFRDDRRRRPSRLLDARHVVIALLGVLDDDSVLDGREPRRFQKPLNGPLWRTNAWALFLFADGWRLLGNVPDHQCQPPRCRERLGDPGFEPASVQPSHNEPLQILRSLALKAGGDFLGKQFQQQFRHQRAHGLEIGRSILARMTRAAKR